MKFPIHKFPRFSRIYMSIILIVVDIITALTVFSSTIVFWNWVKKDIIISQYVTLIPFVLLFIVAFALMDLYPAIGLSPVTQFKLIYISTSVVFLIFGALSFLVKVISEYSRGIFLISWVLCLLLFPVIRNICVRFLSKRGFWGDPVVVIGHNNRSKGVVRQLLDHPEYGFVPIVIMNYFPINPGSDYRGIPILNGKRINILDDNEEYSNLQTAFVVPSEIDKSQIAHFLKDRQYHFCRIITIPEGELGSLWVTPYDIGGSMGYELKYNLLSNQHQFYKRGLDLALILIALPIVLILGLFLAIIIKFDSTGSVFFREPRIGFNGTVFTVWKFRTMISNSKEDFYAWLQNHPEMMEEWEKTHKLKNDPRITKVGKFLRKFSLDEFPQLINVVLNEMSLVGPRPITEDELVKYGERIHLYKKVKPGLSGLWQISGRNDLTYETRVDLDEYYVRNYSIWTDLYILSRTPEVVLSNRGAY